MKKITVLLFLVTLLCLSVSSDAQETVVETFRLSSKLQIAIEPEEIILTKGITAGTDDRKIQMNIRETSGLKNVKLELVARPFTDINSGDIVDVSTVTVGISKQQVSLAPGGLQRVELTIGGFEQAGTYVGGVTLHDTVSGERKDISIRVSVKDSWEFPIAVLLISVLLASGVNYWAKKGRRKNRIDQKVAELQKTMKLAGVEYDHFLVEAEQFLGEAREHNQEYRFEHAEAAIAGIEQKLVQYEERKQNKEELHQKIQELLNDIRESGARDPQSSRIGDELIRLLPKIQTDYEEIDAIFKQIGTFFEAYRMARRDLQIAREKLFSSLDYVKKADKSKIELILSDIDRILTTAESMSAIDEVNILLRKAAFELSPEKINENMFRSQRLQKILDEYQERVKKITGEQVKAIVQSWYQKAQESLEDNRYEDVDEALHKLDQTLVIVDKIKQAEKRIKGREPKMTEFRRIIRDCKRYLEGTSWNAIHRAEHDILQVIEILDGIREQYESFRTIDQQESRTEVLDETAEDAAQEPARAEPPRPEGGSSADIRPLTHEDLRRNLDQRIEEAAQYPKLRGKIVTWRSYCDKLLEFDELTELFEYLRLIQDELSLYTRMQVIRAQAEVKHLHAGLRLVERAEQLLLAETQEDRSTYHRAEVLVDAAKALLEEKQDEGEFEQVISYIRTPKTVSKIVTYGSLASYFAVATALGFQILYNPNPDFGAIVFEDYFSLVLWALGLEGAKITAINVYEAYFKKEG